MTPFSTGAICLVQMSVESDQRDFVMRALKRSGVKYVSTLAKKAGVDPSTLSKFMRGTRDGHVLTFPIIHRLETFSGETFNASSMVPAPPALGEPEAQRLDPASGTALESLVNAARGGRNTVDPWLLKSRALEAMGLKPGDTLLVDLAMQPKPGDVVCAQVYDWQKGRAETVFRRFDPPYLVAASNDLDLLRPYYIDGQNVRIAGVVTDSFRTLR